MSLIIAHCFLVATATCTKESIYLGKGRGLEPLGNFSMAFSCTHHHLTITVFDLQSSSISHIPHYLLRFLQTAFSLTSFPFSSS